MKNLILFFSFFQSYITFAQSVTIDPRNTATNIIDAKSTNQGITVPKMTTAQKGAIANRVEGMMVYDTDAKQFSYWTGTTWVNFGNSVTAGIGWSQTGNDIINTNTGKVEIGSTNATTYKFNVVDNGNAIYAGSSNGNALKGVSTNGIGVSGITSSPYFTAAVSGVSYNTGSPGGYFTAPFLSGGPALVTGFGNAGFGNSTPKKRVDINGAIKVSGAQHESLIRLNNSNFNLSFNRDHQMANDLSNIRNIRIELTTLPVNGQYGCGSHTPYEIYLPPYDQLTYSSQELTDYHDYTGQVITFFLAESNLKAIGDTRVDISSSIGNGIRVKTIATIRHYGSCHPFGTKPSVNFVKIMFDGTEWIAIEN